MTTALSFCRRTRQLWRTDFIDRMCVRTTGRVGLRIPTPTLCSSFSSTTHVNGVGSSKTAPILKNEKIPHEMVMVISVTGQNMGAMRLNDALASFDSTTHDLHLVNANQNPPVCRIVSRKDAFDKARAKKRPEELDLEVKKLILKGGKKARKSLAETHGIEALQQQRKSHANVLKEVEVNSNISNHDLEIKLRKARDMLEKTCRVQFSIIDKKDGKSQGLLAYIEDHLKPISRIAGHPNVSGRKLQATFVPTKTQ